jgi:exopolysaccharide biosynthesis polyprenyl glycosylphosphotransferase
MLCFIYVRIPTIGYIGRIILLNVLVYSSFGALLSFLRIPLYSRSLVLSELIFSVVLILVFFWLRTKLFPITIGVVCDGSQTFIPKDTRIRWVPLKIDSDLNPNIDAITTNLSSPISEEVTRYITHIVRNGIKIYDSRHLEAMLSGKFELDSVSPQDFDAFPNPTIYIPLKRLFDILFTVLVSPLLVAITVIVSLAIRLDTPGPILFRQKRVGFHGKTFWLYKFRSMRHDDSEIRTRFAGKSDDRVTRVGRLIRRTRIDEIPQFWNVFRGEMSIIGPRPEQHGFVAQFSESIPYYSFRHAVRPGITGWAQVTHGYAADENQTRVKLAYDFFYIRNFSFWLDINIFVKTFYILLLGKGAR